MRARTPARSGWRSAGSCSRAHVAAPRERTSSPPSGGRSESSTCWRRLAQGKGPELQEFIDRYKGAGDDHDVEAIVSMHTEDSVFENHTTGDVYIGRDAIAKAITGIFSVFPDLNFEARSQYIRDDLVVQEWTARGTHEGPM